MLLGWFCFQFILFNLISLIFRFLAIFRIIAIVCMAKLKLCLLAGGDFYLGTFVQMDFIIECGRPINTTPSSNGRMYDDITRSNNEKAFCIRLFTISITENWRKILFALNIVHATRRLPFSLHNYFAATHEPCANQHIGSHHLVTPDFHINFQNK